MDWLCDFRVIEENIAALENEVREGLKRATDILFAEEDTPENEKGERASVIENNHSAVSEHKSLGAAAIYPGRDDPRIFPVFEPGDRTEPGIALETFYNAVAELAPYFTGETDITNTVNEAYDLEPGDLFISRNQREFIYGLDMSVYSESSMLGGDTIFESADLAGAAAREPGRPPGEFVLELAAGERTENSRTEIRVDARSVNTVSSAIDLDEMTRYIGEKLREAMCAAAEGVH